MSKVIEYVLWLKTLSFAELMLIAIPAAFAFWFFLYAVRLYIITIGVAIERGKLRKKERRMRRDLKKHPELATEKGRCMYLAKAFYENACQTADECVRVGEWTPTLAEGMKQYYLEEYNSRVAEINKKFR